LVLPNSSDSVVSLLRAILRAGAMVVGLSSTCAILLLVIRIWPYSIALRLVLLNSRDTAVSLLQAILRAGAI
jgi:hypothetical protein